MGSSNIKVILYQETRPPEVSSKTVENIAQISFPVSSAGCFVDFLTRSDREDSESKIVRGIRDRENVFCGRMCFGIKKPENIAGDVAEAV